MTVAYPWHYACVDRTPRRHPGKDTERSPWLYPVWEETAYRNSQWTRRFGLVEVGRAHRSARKGAAIADVPLNYLTFGQRVSRSNHRRRLSPCCFLPPYQPVPFLRLPLLLHLPLCCTTHDNNNMNPSNLSSSPSFAVVYACIWGQHRQLPIFTPLLNPSSSSLSLSCTLSL